MFGDVFSKILQEKGISGYKVSKDTGISVGLISNYKNNIKVPTNDNLIKLSKYLDVPINVLLEQETEQNENIKVYDEHDNIVVLDDETRDIIDALRTKPEMKILFSVSKKATKEDILQAVKIIEALRSDD